MMRIALWILVIFASATLIAVGAYYNSGYVLFIAPPYRVDMSMNLLVVIVLALVFGSYSVVRLLMKTLSIPATLRKMSERRTERKSYKALNNAVIAHFEGRYETAEKLARTAILNEECKSAGALIGASSAYFMNKPDMQFDYEKNIAQNHELAKATTEVLKQLSQQQPEEALKTIQLIESKLGKNIATVELAFRVYKQQNAWNEILKSLDTLGNRNILTKNELDDWRFKCHSELLKQNAENPDALVKQFSNLSDDLKNNELLITLTLDLLSSNPNATTITARFIENQLSRQWNDVYLSAYSSLSLNADEKFVASQLKFAEKLLSNHKDNSELLLVLGQLNFKLNHFDQALQFAQKAIEIQESSEAHGLLGLIAESTGNAELALKHYKASANLMNYCN